MINDKESLVSDPWDTPSTIELLDLQVACRLSPPKGEASSNYRPLAFPFSLEFSNC